MSYGLRDEVVEAIVGVLSGEPRIEKVTLFGSRAKGSYREGSDIDLCLTGSGLDLAALSPSTIDRADSRTRRYSGEKSIASRYAIASHPK